MESNENVLNDEEKDALRKETQNNQTLIADTEIEILPYTLVQGDNYSAVAAYPGISAINKLFVHELVGRLYKFVRRRVQVQPLSLKMMTITQYWQQLEKGSAIYLAKVTSHQTHCLVTLSPKWLYCLMSLLFGGKLRPDEDFVRAPGKIEQRMGWFMAEHLMAAVNIAWKDVWQLQYEINTAVTEPSLLTMLNEQDKIAICSYVLTVDEVQSQVEVCLDLRLLEPLRETQKNTSTTQTQEEILWEKQLLDNVLEAPVSVISYFPDIPLKFVDLMNLKVGDTIALEDPQRVELLVEDLVKYFIGRAATRNGNRVVEIENKNQNIK